MSQEELIGVVSEELRNKNRALFYKLENNPENLTSEEIEKLVKASSKKRIKDIKEYNFFDEYYTGNKVKLLEAIEKLSDPAYKCFSILVLKYTSNSNTLQYKNNVNIVKDKDISKLLDISISKWYSVKKELNECGAMRKIKLDNKPFIKINPTIIGHSMKITKCTYYAFREVLIEEFEPLKKLYWDKMLVEEFGIDILKTSKI